MDRVFENNKVTIAGTVASDFRFSHKVYGEGFYVVDVEVLRLSEYKDCIPVMVSERMMNVWVSHIGERISVNGQFRSFNRHDENRNHLVLFVFAREIEFLGELQSNLDCNQIFLDGYICRKPIYRKTLLGREIADVLLAVNRRHGKSDYIPCICWGRNARFTPSLEVGRHVQITGRIQSREYVKKLSETEAENRVAYEVSVSKIELVEEE